VTKYEPFDYIYASYKLDPDLEDLYARVESDDVYVAEDSKESASRSTGPNSPSSFLTLTKTKSEGGVTSRKKAGKGEERSNAATNKDKDDYHNARIFHKSVRIELLLAILQDKQSRGGANVNLPELFATGVIEAFYPVCTYMCVFCNDHLMMFTEANFCLRLVVAHICFHAPPNPPPTDPQQ